jgi:hypothetical protein
MLRRLLIVASLITVTIAGLSATGHVSAADDVWATEHVSATGLDAVTATRLAVTVRDVVYDPIRDVLYASVVDTDPTYANQIITVDPNTNQIVANRSIGTRPAALAIADDGTALYVGVDGRGTVEKYSLSGWTKQWAYQFGMYIGYQIVAGDIEAMPGGPDTIAVSQKAPGLSPSHTGVVVIDGGVARPDITHGHTGSNSIVFGANAATLYGSDTEISSQTFYVHEIGSTGITERQAIRGLGGGKLAYRSGLVYESNGKITDVTGATPSLADTLPSATAVALDPDGSSVYYVTRTHASTTTSTLRAYRTSDRQPVGTWTIPNEQDFVGTLVSAGQGWFAYITSQHSGNRSGNLVLIQTGPAITGAFGEYTALTPTRILDTRSGLGTGVVAPLQAGQSIDVSVLGAAGVPVVGVQAVVLNATAVSPTEAGFITLYPRGTARPTISSLNFGPGQVVANLVTMPVGTAGMVTAYSPFGAVDVVFDIAGFYATDAGPSGLRYHPVAPARLVDTRNGQGGHAGALGADTSATFQVSGQAGVPSSGVSAVALNVTVTDTTAPSFLTVHPADVGLPVVSNLNFVGGTTRANQAIVRLPSNGLISVYNSAGSTQVIIDVVGYYDTNAVGEHGRFVALNPFRAIDTRSDSPFGGTGALPNNSVLYAGAANDVATAYVLNVTVTGTTGSGFVTALPFRNVDSAVPVASTLNYGPGDTVPNHAIVPTGPYLGFYNTGATAHLIVDVFGAFT